jgi:hypothetical protein
MTHHCSPASTITTASVNTSTSKTYATKYTAASYLITFDDDEDPEKTTKAIEEFIQANTIPSKRINELTTGGSLVGAYKLTSKTTITPILLLSRVSLTDSDGHNEEKLLGQGTNDATEFRPELLDLAAANNIFVVTTETSPPSLFKKNVGASFELKEIETTVPPSSPLPPSPVCSPSVKPTRACTAEKWMTQQGTPSTIASQAAPTGSGASCSTTKTPNKPLLNPSQPIPKSSASEFQSSPRSHVR